MKLWTWLQFSSLVLPAMGWLWATCWIHTLIQSLLSTGTTHTSAYEIFQFRNELESQDISLPVKTDF